MADEMKRAELLGKGTVLSMPDLPMGYCAWPSVARNDAGALVVVCSGYRLLHVCPFGKVVMVESRNNGESWSAPRVPVDTPLDDRDAGILNLGGGRMLVSTFNNTRAAQWEWSEMGEFGHSADKTLIRAYLPEVTDAMEEAYLGSLLSLSEDGGFSWSAPWRAPVTAPHGPNKLAGGGIVYAGSRYRNGTADDYTEVYQSDDLRHFNLLAAIPKCPELDGDHYLYSEPHVIELPAEGGAPARLLVHIRVEALSGHETWDEKVFTIVQSVSDDGGKTWSAPVQTGASGAPPHLIRHSSGALVCVYGQRRAPYGIRAMISRDRGGSWDAGYWLWDEGLGYDLGYPCSVELDDGTIFTVFYAKKPGMRHASILWTRWRLPG